MLAIDPTNNPILAVTAIIETQPLLPNRLVSVRTAKMPTDLPPAPQIVKFSRIQILAALWLPTAVSAPVACCDAFVSDMCQSFNPNNNCSPDSTYLPLPDPLRCLIVISRDDHNEGGRLVLYMRSVVL